jgi:hypothetical protein
MASECAVIVGEFMFLFNHNAETSQQVDYAVQVQ